ncbi:MAG: hypothetical protein Q9159_002088, partial [Coniocarpon cinnabarinum]
MHPVSLWESVFSALTSSGASKERVYSEEDMPVNHVSSEKEPESHTVPWLDHAGSIDYWQQPFLAYSPVPFDIFGQPSVTEDTAPTSTNDQPLYDLFAAEDLPPEICFDPRILEASPVAPQSYLEPSLSAPSDLLGSLLVPEVAQNRDETTEATTNGEDAVECSKQGAADHSDLLQSLHVPPASPYDHLVQFPTADSVQDDDGH